MRSAAFSLLAILLAGTCLAAGHDATTPVRVPVPAYSQGMLATDGSTFLIVFAIGPTIYGSFASADGTPINSLPLPLVRLSQIGTYQIAAIGGHYVLYWTDGGIPYLGDVTLDGQVRNTRRVDAPPLVTPMIATVDSSLLVVGQNSEPGPAHDDAQIIRSDGSLIAEPIPVSNTWGLREAIALGDTFVVTTTEANRVFIQRFARDGTLLPPGRVKLSSNNATAGHAVAATDGNRIVVVWSERTAPQDLFFSALLTPDLNVAKRQSTIVSDVPFISDTGVVWNGNQYIATAIVGDRAGVSRTVAMHLDRDAAVSDITAPFDAIVQRLASNGDTAYGVGVDKHGVMTTWSLDAATLAVRRSQPLSYGLPEQRFPSVASDGVDFGCAFSEASAATTASKLALFSRNGVPKSGEGIVLQTDGSRPRIAYGDSTYLVVWAGVDAKVYVRRISSQGFPIDPQPVAVAAIDSWGPDPILIWNGRAFFVVWSRGGEFYGTFVGSDGSVSAEQHLAPYGVQPSIAWNGRIFLLVFGTPWSSGLEGPPLYGDLEGVRIAASGSLLDTKPILLFHQDNTVIGATIASDGIDFMMAVDRLNGLAVLPITSSNDSVSAGQLRHVFNWLHGTTSDITYDGQDYFIGWRYSGVRTSWIAAGRVNRDGALQVDGAQQFLPAVDWSISVASNRAGDNALMISESTPDTFTPRARAYFARELPPMPQPPRPPEHVTASGTRPSVTVRWEATADAEGVVIDAPGLTYPLAVVAASAGVATIQYPPSVVRIRTFNASGFSEPLMVNVMLPPRRRASR